MAILLSFVPPVLLGNMIPLQLFAALSGFAMFIPKLEHRVLSNNVEKIIFYIFYPAQWIVLYLLVNYL